MVEALLTDGAKVNYGAAILEIPAGILVSTGLCFWFDLGRGPT